MSRTQDIYVAADPKTGRIMTKDARGGLHCGLSRDTLPHRRLGRMQNRDGSDRASAATSPKPAR